MDKNENLEVEEKEEVTPVAQFDDREDDAKINYENSVQEKKVFFANCLIANITKVVFAIICYIFTTKTGSFGTILFMVATFYFMPIGIIRTFVYAYRFAHAKDYVAFDNDYVAIDLFHFMHRHLARKK
ncbi:MAG: hypothetical protein K5829_06075 [Treponema sp.]|nr:hypothetical protein [Treponema sp.]